MFYKRREFNIAVDGLQLFLELSMEEQLWGITLQKSLIIYALICVRDLMAKHNDSILHISKGKHYVSRICTKSTSFLIFLPHSYI